MERMSKKLNMNNSNCSKQTIIKMGQVLSIPDCVEELEQDQEEAVGRQDQDTDSEAVGRQDTTNEAVGRQDTCQICHSIDIDKATSSCDSQYNDYILCSSCHYDLCSQNDTLIECEYCGNLWDGHAQCNCYYEEDDDM
mgnify:CR=1 FL=1